MSRIAGAASLQEVAGLAERLRVLQADVRAVQAATRRRRADLEGLPRDAGIDYGHEGGQIMSLMWLEQMLVSIQDGREAIVTEQRRALGGGHELWLQTVELAVGGQTQRRYRARCSCGAEVAFRDSGRVPDVAARNAATDAWLRAHVAFAQQATGALRPETEAEV